MARFKVVWNDVLIVLSLSLPKFMVGFITSMVIPIFPSWISLNSNGSLWNISSGDSLTVNSSDYNHLRLSILFSTKNIFMILCSPVLGCLIDLCGALVFLLSGAIFQVMTVLVYGTGEVYSLLILGRLLEAVSASSINVAGAALIAFHFKDAKQRGFVYGVNGLSLCLGSSLGPAFGGVIYQYFGKCVAFLSTISIICVEILVVILVIFKEKKAVKESLIEVNLEVKKDCKEKEEDQKSFIEIDHEVKKDYISSMENIIPIPLTELIGTLNVVNHDEEVVVKNGSNVETVRNSFIEERNEKAVERKEVVNHNACMFIKDPYFLISMGTFPVIFVSIFILFSTLPHYMNVKFNATASQQGLIWILNLLGYVLGFISGNIINTKFARQRHIVLVVYTLIHSAGMACVEVMPTWWSISVPLCTIVHVHLVAEIVIAPIFATIVETRHHSKFGVMSGIIMMTIAATGSCGSFLGPILMGVIGFKYMNIGVCVINILYAPLYLLLGKFCSVR